MKYRCCNCGCIFDEDEAGERVEHEEFWGAIVPITYMTCPECDEDISDEEIISDEEVEEDE